MNTVTNEGTVFVKFVMQLGQNKLPKIDCSEMYNIEVSKQRLELQKMQLEMELLKAQLAAAKAANKPISTGDDW